MKPIPTLFWHALPLHYMPHLFATGCLYSQDELKAQNLPIRPRRTAERRDRKLRLSRFIHLSFTPQTPLLIDKRGKGYPHTLLAFDAAIVASPDASLIPFNTKVCVTVNGDITISAETGNSPAFPSAPVQSEPQEVATNAA